MPAHLRVLLPPALKHVMVRRHGLQHGPERRVHRSPAVLARCPARRRGLRVQQLQQASEAHGQQPASAEAGGHVQVAQVGTGGEVVGQQRRDGQALQRAIHVAGVAQVVQAARRSDGAGSTSGVSLRTARQERRGKL